MRLSSVRIQNFRSFKDETIHFNDYTCLVGPNGGGKSTVLTALNVFFRQSNHSNTDLLKLDKEDFHHRNYQEPAQITVTFVDLSEEAQQDLKDYYRQGKLIISSVANWNDDDGFAQVIQYGQRMGMKAFKPFFKAEGDGAPVKELKEEYAKIRLVYSDLPAPGTKQAMIDALREYEASNPDKCVTIMSEDQFYGVTKGKDRLTKYLQWVFVPAVKDASEEQREANDTILGLLVKRKVRHKVSFKEPIDELMKETDAKYQTILDSKQDVLEELSTSVSSRLSAWAHPGTNLLLKWMNEQGENISIEEPFAQFIAGEGHFKGKLDRVGHGFQRSFILALLEELATNDGEGGPMLILACEEPELYQHPPQARHVASVMQKLATKNAQVILCTHSPYFVTGRYVEDVRSIRAHSIQKCSSCKVVTLDQISECIGAACGEKPTNKIGTMLKIEQALQPALNEIFFANVLILVEGIEDVAFLTTYFTLLDCWDEYRKLGCHMVPVGGKSELIRPTAITQKLQIPTFVVFDSDKHNCPEEQDDKNGKRARHAKDNIAIQKLCGIENPDPFPSETLWRTNLVMWKSEICEVIKDEVGKDEWIAIANEVRRTHRIDVGDINKNCLFIGYCLLVHWNDGKRKIAALERLCQEILRFARCPGGL